MNDIAAKLKESVDALRDEEVDQVIEEDEADAPEPSESELLARDSGWDPSKTDKDGVSLSAEEFLARKPLFNKIGNQSKQIEEMNKALKEMKADQLKLASASYKEKQDLLMQLEEKKEAALNNLDADDVRKYDKQIKSVEKELADAPREANFVSPYFEDFTKDNPWALDEDDPLQLVAEGIAIRYSKNNKGDIDDKRLYKHIHDEVRKVFPEKFQPQPRAVSNKVAATKSRSTTNYNSKKQMTINDVPDDGTREVIKNTAFQVGKTVEEYLKNYTPDDFR